MLHGDIRLNINTIWWLNKLVHTTFVASNAYSTKAFNEVCRCWKL